MCTGVICLVVLLLIRLYLADGDARKDFQDVESDYRAGVGKVFAPALRGAKAPVAEGISGGKLDVEEGGGAVTGPTEMPNQDLAPAHAPAVNPTAGDGHDAAKKWQKKKQEVAAQATADETRKAAREYAALALSRGVAYAAMGEHLQTRDAYGHVADAFKKTAADHLADMNKQFHIVAPVPVKHKVLRDREPPKLHDVLKRAETEAETEALHDSLETEAEQFEQEEPVIPAVKKGGRPSHAFSKYLLLNSRVKHHRLGAGHH
jgi:hypothetical protein